MKIFVGTDHNGYQMHNIIVEHLRGAGYDVENLSNKELDPGDDFPLFAARVVNAMKASDDPEPRGILVCGSGQGMCMAANRFKGIRAALLYDGESARTSRNDDDSNVACLSSRELENNEAMSIVDTWLRTSFAASARFVRRVKEIDELN